MASVTLRSFFRMLMEGPSTTAFGEAKGENGRGQTLILNPQFIHRSTAESVHGSERVCHE